MTVCRVCLNRTLLHYALNVVVNGQQIGLMLKTCVPELYLGLSKSPILCDICTKNLVVAYNFRKTCLKTEEYIGEYLRKAKTSHTQIELEDVVDLILKENTQKSTEADKVREGTVIENINPFNFRIENVVSLQETNENVATKVDNIKKESENEDSNDVVVIADDSSEKQNKEPVLQMISMLQPIAVEERSTDLPMRSPSHLAELPALTSLDKKQMKSSASFISTNRFGLVQTPRGPTIVKFRQNIPQPRFPKPTAVRDQFQKPTASKQFRIDKDQETIVSFQQNMLPFQRHSSAVSLQQPLILNSIITPSAQTQSKKNPLLSHSAKPVKKKTSENSGSLQQKMKYPLVSYSRTSSSSERDQTASSKETTFHASTQKVSVVTSQNSVTSVPSMQTSVAPVFSLMSPITHPSTSSPSTFQQQFIDVVDSRLKHEKLRTLLSKPLTDNSTGMATAIAVTQSIFSHSSVTTSLPSPNSGNSATLSDWESRLAGNYEGEIEKELSDSVVDPLALDVHNLETLPQHKEHQEHFCDDDHINALLEGIPEMEAEDIPEYIKIKRIHRVEQPLPSQAPQSMPGLTALVPPKADSPKPRRRCRTTSFTNIGHSPPNRKRKRSLSPKVLPPDIRNGYYICDHDYVRGNFSCQDTTDSNAMFHCYICDYEEKVDFVAVNQHMRQHDNPKDLVCHMCSRTFATPVCLNIHIMKHPIICIVCNTEVEFYIFKEHQEMHCEYYTVTTGNGEDGEDQQVIKQKKFKCRHCPSYFKTGKAFEKHKRCHWKERTRRRSTSLSAVS